MKKISHNQAGFGVVEALLIVIIILLVGFIGYYVHNSQKTADKNLSTTASSASSTKAKQATTKPQLSDNEQIVAAVKAYTFDDSTVQTQTDDTVTVSKIVGANAQGDFRDASGDGGAAFIAHKDNGTWKVVFEGQEAPGYDLGHKYDLPSDWYSADYQ